MEKLIDSPVSTVASFLLNPTTLVLVVYLSSVAWGQVSWLQVNHHHSILFIYIICALIIYLWLMIANFQAVWTWYISKATRGAYS